MHVKGQLSVEFLLIAVLVLVSSALIFKSYQAASSSLLVEANLKSFADWELATASLNSPGCGNTHLAGIKRNSSNEGYVLDYEFRTTDSSCASQIFGSDDFEFMNGSMKVILGCDFSDAGPCQGFDVWVHD